MSETNFAFTSGAGAVLGAGDDGRGRVLRLAGEVPRRLAVGHVGVVEELLGDPAGEHRSPAAVRRRSPRSAGQQ